MCPIIKKIIYRILYLINEIKAAKYLGVKIGENCRLLKCTFSTEPYLVKIGNHVSATRTHFETHDVEFGYSGINILNGTKLLLSQ